MHSLSNDWPRKLTIIACLGCFSIIASTASSSAIAQLEPIAPITTPQTVGTQSFDNLPPPSSFRPTYASQPLYRIKDISFPEGDRDNVINGLGLVVGLSQTGGRSAQTQLMAQNYYRARGIAITDPETRAMSSVEITGIIKPNTRKGEKIQVTVSVTDDATSLRGGVLIRTPLRGLDGQIYAIAEGQVLGGGVAAGGAAANTQRDHPTVAVCNAIIEREICCDENVDNSLRLILRNKEYSTAVSIASALNTAFPRSSQALDYGTVEIKIPNAFRNRRTDFISLVGRLEVPVDPTARVVINQKTGTIILGQNVRISPVVFAKGSLVISTAETPIASQPAPLSNGETVVLPRTSLDVRESGGPYSRLGGGTTVGELGQALNALGFTPNLMIEMFTSLKNTGALQAELIIE